MRIPVNDRKQPLVRWADPTQIPPRHQWPQHYGEARLCGIGGVEVIDFDVPDKLTSDVPPAWEPWLEIVREHKPELADRLAIVQTPSGGRHVVYRCPEPGRNQKLAGLRDGRVTIETRGRGGYAVCPPTPGYVWLQGGEETIPTLSQSERDMLIEAALLLDEREPEPDHELLHARARHNGTLRAGDDFEQKASWAEILEPRGWVKAGTWEGQTLWRRPGKSEGWSAKTGVGTAGDRMYVWTTSTPIPAGRALTKFAILAHLDFGGDFGRCAEWLRAQGYGSGPQAQAQQTQPQPQTQIQVQAPIDPETGRPKIDVAGRQTSAVVADTLAAMATPPYTVYQYGGALVAHGPHGLVTLTAAGVRGAMAGVADWYRGDRIIEPPRSIAEMISAAPDWPGIPEIRGVYAHPVLVGGKLLEAAGYHPAEHTLITCGVAGSVGGAPRWYDAAGAARWLLTEVLGDFPFAGDADRAHALALMILPFVRPAINGPTPLHLIDAPTPATGKSLLAQACLAPALGLVQLSTLGDDDEEVRKSITSALISGAEAVVYDNLAGRVDSVSLTAALTTTHAWTDRVLGSSRTVSLPVRVVWAATANNAELTRDIARRSILIELDAGVERPEDRQGFRHPFLLGWIAENRGMVIGALLTIVRSWVAAGMPRWSGRSMGSYEEWAGVIGGILEHCGIPGFLGNVEELRAGADPVEVAWAGAIELWWQRHGDAEVTVTTLADTVFVASDIRLALAIEAESDSGVVRRLGRRLAERRGRVYAGHRLTSRMRDGVMRYRLV